MSRAALSRVTSTDELDQILNRWSDKFQKSWDDERIRRYDEIARICYEDDEFYKKYSNKKERKKTLLQYNEQVLKLIEGM